MGFIRFSRINSLYAVAKSAENDRFSRNSSYKLYRNTMENKLLTQQTACACGLVPPHDYYRTIAYAFLTKSGVASPEV